MNRLKKHAIACVLLFAACAVICLILALNGAIAVSWIR